MTDHIAALNEAIDCALNAEQRAKFVAARDAFVALVAESGKESQRMDWLAERFKTCTVYMSGQHPYYPHMHKLSNLRGPTFRAAIDNEISKEQP